MLRDFVLECYAAGEVNAKIVCIFSFLADKAGACGIGDLGFKPDAPTGHYNNHLKLVLRLAQPLES